MDSEKNVEFDEDGFLKRWEDWSTELAKDLARQEAIELREDHWKVITFLRNYYLKFGATPMVRTISKASGLTAKELYTLFPNGPLRQAAKIGGLPKPVGCL